MARKASKGTFIEFVSYCYFCICDLLKSEDWPWCHMSEWLMVFWYTLHDMMMRWYEWCFYRKVDLAMSLFTAQKAQSRSTEFPPQLMTGFWGGMTTLLEWLLYFFFSNVFGFFFMCCVDVPRSLIVFLANQVVLLGVAWLQIVKTSPLRLRSSDFSPWQKKECWNSEFEI